MADTIGASEVISSQDDLQVKLQQLIDGEKIPENWPDNYMYHPSKQGTSVVAVQDEQGQNTYYSAWLKRGEDGTFNQVELKTFEEMNAMYYALPAGPQVEDKHKTISVKVGPDGKETIVNDRVPPGVRVPDDGLEYRAVQDIPEDIALDRQNRHSAGTGIREAIQNAAGNLESLRVTGKQVNSARAALVETRQLDAQYGNTTTQNNVREAEAALQAIEGKHALNSAPVVFTASLKAIEQTPDVGFTPAPQTKEPAAAIAQEAKPTSTQVSMPAVDFQAAVAAYTSRPEKGSVDNFRPAAQELRQIDRMMRKDPLAENQETQEKIMGALEKYPGYADILASYVQDRIGAPGEEGDGLARARLYTSHISMRRTELHLGGGVLSPKSEDSPQVTGPSRTFNQSSGLVAPVIVNKPEVDITEKDLSRFKPTGDLAEDYNRAQQVLDAIKFQHMGPADQKNALPESQVAELVKDYRAAGYKDFSDIMGRMQADTNDANYAQTFSKATNELHETYQERYHDLRAGQESATEYPSLPSDNPVREKLEAQMQGLSPEVREELCKHAENNPAIGSMCKP